MARKSEKAEIPIPYSMGFRIKGTRGFLFSAPPENLDDKPPKIPKRPDHEKKVWRSNGGLAYPGHQIIKRLSIAGRGTPNPAPMGKGSAMAPIKQAISVADDAENIPFLVAGDGKVYEEWDDVLKSWVGAKSGGFAWRPYLEPGWEMEFNLACAYPQWFSSSELHQLVGIMGLIGIGDGTVLGYGRFVIIEASVPESVENWIR